MPSKLSLSKKILKRLYDVTWLKHVYDVTGGDDQHDRAQRDQRGGICGEGHRSAEGSGRDADRC